MSKKHLLKVTVQLLVLSLLSFCFQRNAYAAETTLMSVNQDFQYLNSSIAAVSQEKFVNNIAGINYLTIKLGNSEHHWYCAKCGGRSTATTATMKILGYTKSTDTEEIIKTYTVSGLDGSSPRSATYQLMVTDDIKEKYGYFKISLYITGAASGACSCPGSGGYFSNGTAKVSVTANTFDNPTIQTSGNLTDKTFTEGVSDFVGSINAYFPSGTESYRWQYSEGGSWVNIADGTESYATNTHGEIHLSDKNGGHDFSSSNMLRLDNPEVNMTGLKFRAILLSGNSGSDTTSNESIITVKSRDISGFNSIRFASRYGQVGEKISPNDIIAFVKFNNGQIVDAESLSSVDSRVKFYGFVTPDASSKGLSEEQIVSKMSNGELNYTELVGNDNNLKIKAGDNTFFAKFSYEGSVEKEIFSYVSFTGKDEVPPVFDENVELYESDGMTLYTGSDYEISDRNTSRKLIIKGTIADSISAGDDVSWAYTLTGTKDSKNGISIPVYRKGSEINIAANVNGVYTLLAEDTSGNTASKVITVKAYDENDPQIDVTANKITANNSKVVSGYVIEVEASDAEKLNRKPYLYKRFNTAKEAEEYNLIAVSDNEYVSGNTKSISQPGYYLVAVRDAVGKTASKVLAIPVSGDVLDATRPEISILPRQIKDSKGEVTEYDIEFVDNNAVKSFVIKNDKGEVIVNENHNHESECQGDVCIVAYHFKPQAPGRYSVVVEDAAGNTTSAAVNAVKREIESIEITDLPDSMAVNTKISVDSLVTGSRILLKMNDGTTEVFSANTGGSLICKDGNGNTLDGVTIGYGVNELNFELVINKGTEAEKKYTFSKTIIGEDNVAPIPGEYKTLYSEGWDGSLTNNLSNVVTLKAEDFADDGSEKGNLIITWYKDDVEIKRAAVKDGGDVYGPFSGEEYNGSYRYTITDEKDNFCNSTSVKVIDCWDTTAPTGEVKLMPDGVTTDSKARYKQIQIINASDNYALAEKPYSFNGNKEENYTVIGSVVAGENNTYEIYLRDAVGNVAHLQDVTLTGIDSVSPTINGYETNKNDDGKLILHVDATDTDSDGNDNSDSLKYSIDGSNYQDSPDFEINESGEYTIYVKDETGNVTKTGTDYNDTDNPSVSVMQDETGAGVIIVTASDNVGLSKIVMECPDGSKEILQIYDGAADDTIRKEIGKTGTYTITVTDLSGNTASASVNIDSIKAACSSSILSGLKLNPSEWTSGDVMVVAELVDTNGLSAAPFRWNGSIPTAKPYVIVTENGTANVEICDMYGNSIVSDSIQITNIDRVSPVMNELKQTEDKNHVAVNVSDEGSGIAQVTISGGPYSVEMGAIKLQGEKTPKEILITLPTNGTYTVRAYDIAGNSCQRQITVDGVTTDVAKVVTEEKEKIVTVDNVITQEKVVTQDRIVTQNVEVPTPVIVPLPSVEYITKYKYLRDEGEDTSKLITGDDKDGDNTKETASIKDDTSDKSDDVEKSEEKNEISEQDLREIGLVGEKTADGTYIAPDGYEYFDRVDPKLKDDHPFKYWFKKNAEKIATAMCIIALILLILCLVMGYLLTKDYIQEQIDKREIDKMSKNK